MLSRLQENNHTSTYENNESSSLISTNLSRSFFILILSIKESYHQKRGKGPANDRVPPSYCAKEHPEGFVVSAPFRCHYNKPTTIDFDDCGSCRPALRVTSYDKIQNRRTPCGAVLRKRNKNKPCAKKLGRRRGCSVQNETGSLNRREELGCL